MEPKYHEDDDVFVSYTPFLFSKPKKGDVIVFKKFNLVYVKRVAKIKEGKYFLAGDNKKDSQDSRRFGSVSLKQIKGKVLFKISDS